jgi:anti-sigma factor RsiW
MAKHPSDLVPYLRGDLPPADRERVARHLDECPDCRHDTEQLRELMGHVARALGQPPEPSWARYRAELREKLEARRGRRGWVRGLTQWWWRPVPLALSAGAAAVLLLVAVWTGREMLTGGDPFALDEVAIGRQLGFLEEYQVVERLDLLEDLDVISNLDGLDAGRQG